MKAIMLVALGGAVGSVARLKISTWILHPAVGWKFPVGTFTVNVLGCLVAGMLAGMAEKHDLLSADARVLLFTGLLGGFTTFSAFGVETVYLLRRGELLIAFANVALSVAAGLLALWIGLGAVLKWPD